ncbi:MAG: glycosyltransferase family 4 protein [Pseudomonadota bacterium]
MPEADGGDRQREIAFYAPLKSPDHPTPSGDRQIARLTLEALARAGFTPRTASDLRLFDRDGDEAVQQDLARASVAEAERVIADLRASPPALWFTYHCYYKAPDLIGPRVAEALGIPYAISEPSISMKRRTGPWARFAAASEAAIARADRLFWTTRRDRPALEQAGHKGRLTHLPAFLAEGPPPKHRGAHDPVRLLTVAMMRPGDKLESYRRLAAALGHLDGPWLLTVIGDGEAAAAVRALLSRFSGQVHFRGQIEEASAMRAAYAAADVFVWPGVGEGVGMVYLEAQAAGLPVVAENHAAQRDLVAAPLVPVGDAQAFAAAIEETRIERRSLSIAARSHVVEHHGLGAAARILRAALGPLVT